MLELRWSTLHLEENSQIEGSCWSWYLCDEEEEAVPCQDCGVYNRLGNAQPFIDPRNVIVAKPGSRVVRRGKRAGHFNDDGKWVTPGGQVLDGKPDSAVEEWEFDEE